jgi:tol-pal system protein YbgF
MVPTGKKHDKQQAHGHFALAVYGVTLVRYAGHCFNPTRIPKPGRMAMKRTPMRNVIFISVVLSGLMTLIGCVTPSDVNTIDTRLTEMEMRDVQQRQHREQLKSEFETYSQELRKQSAGLRAELEELNEDIRILSGRLEEMEYAFKQQQQNAADLENNRQARLDSISERVEENSERLSRMDQYLNLESSKKRVAVATPAAGAKKPASEDALYRAAKQAFDQGDFDAARQQFQEFIKRYPNSKNADNAQFWIGEIYYREKWYEKAILEYQNVIEKYPKGNKAPAALLKQGLAFSNIGDTANAKLILEELGRKYPNSNEAKVAAEKLKTMK